MIGGKAHVGEDVGLGLVHEGRELRQLGPELVGDLAPLGLGGFGAVLREGGSHEGRDDPAAAFSRMGGRIAHGVDAAALPGGVHQLGDRRLDPLMGVGHDELDAAQAPAAELAQKLGPERLGLRGAIPCRAPRAGRRC